MRSSPLPRFLSPFTHAGGPNDLVALDQDHPGFRDRLYRRRRNQIARIALSYQEGEEIPRVRYTEVEHGVWRTVWENLSPLHARYACREYLECARDFPLDREKIPQLCEINARLLPVSGFQMLPVAGLVSERTFLSYLGRGIFLSTQYIRHHSMPLYTPEPDVVHELIGHAVTLFHPDFVRINRAFGEAALVADEETLHQIARLYWYTLEFGVTREGDALKVYGAGLLSSFGELGRFSRAELREFCPETIAKTPYDPTDYQKILYVAPSFQEMAERVIDWLEALR